MNQLLSPTKLPPRSVIVLSDPPAAPIQEILHVRPIRYILVHFHIFKNAGSTIEYVLHRSFGDRYRSIHGPKPDSVLIGPDLARFLIKNPSVSAVSSHHLKYPLPDIPRVRFFDVCFLRDPIQRFWSMHKYFQRAEPNDALSEIAKASDFRSFVEMLVRDHPQLINDVQVNFLANSGVYIRPPSRVDFEAALNALHRIAILGVVDMFDESLIAAEYYIRPIFPIQCQYVRHNTSNNDGDTDVNPSERIRDLLGTRLYKELIGLNRLDLELVACAKEEVSRRLSMVPKRDERRVDLVRRCELLHARHEELCRISMATAG